MEKTKSLENSAVFNGYYPGGHSNLRVSPVEATKHRVFVGGASGCHVQDIDGNDYIAYSGAFGPAIIGHCHPEYVKSLKECIDTLPTLVGSNLMFSLDDIEIAEKLAKYVPCAEQFKLCTSGSEAVQMAIRIARAYTGKNKIVRFNSHYHGWFDNVLGGIIRHQDENNEWVREDPLDDDHYSFGRSTSVYTESIILPWNDFEALELAFEKHHDEMAIVHFESMMCNDCGQYPLPGFLEKIRELCTKYNVVMSVDEVITGIRLGLGGAQAYFNIDADICTMGKAISGGVPISLVAGKKEIMNPLFTNRKVLGPGTFNGWNLGVRAVATTLRILEEDDCAGYKKMAAMQDKLISGIIEICDKYNVDIRIPEAPGVFFTHFKAKGGRKPIYTMDDLEGCDFDYYVKFRAKIQEKGLLLLPGSRWYMSIVHEESDIEKTLQLIDETICELEAGK